MNSSEKNIVRLKSFEQLECSTDKMLYINPTKIISSNWTFCITNNLMNDAFLFNVVGIGLWKQWNCSIDKHTAFQRTNKHNLCIELYKKREPYLKRFKELSWFAQNSFSAMTRPFVRFRNCIAVIISANIFLGNSYFKLLFQS